MHVYGRIKGQRQQDNCYFIEFCHYLDSEEKGDERQLLLCC